MSLDLEEKLKRLLASSPPAVREIVVVSFSHSALTRQYVFWTEPYPASVSTTDGVLSAEFAPVQVEASGTGANLDQAFNVTLDTTDVQDVFRDEMDRIPLDSAEKIRVRIYAFVSNDMAAEQARVELEAESVSYQIGIATISCVAPRYNVLATGAVYSAREIPMLRGFT